MPRYAVVGGTSWGVTLTTLLARGGVQVDLVVRTPEEAGRLRGDRGLTRLPEAVLPPGVTVRPAGGLGSVDGIVLAVPAQSMRATIASLTVSRQTPVLSAAKGIELRTARRMSEVLVECGWRPERISVISGPNLAHEVARGLPAASVIASMADDQASQWQTALSQGAFRCYRSRDVVGVELGGALKNVVAIAAGAAAGLDLGANAIAALVTRGLAEIARLGGAHGADPLTFQGLAGLGDLAATCYSPLSRNRRLGELLAHGLTTEAALAEIGEAVEGATTAPVAVALARRASIDAPIGEAVARVLEGRMTVAEAMASLLSRALRTERDAHAG